MWGTFAYIYAKSSDNGAEKVFAKTMNRAVSKGDRKLVALLETAARTKNGKGKPEKIHRFLVGKPMEVVPA